MNKLTEYVLGYAFDSKLQHVILIRKNKPEWQKGKLNGVGGKIEKDDASPVHAMIREFKEETGASSTTTDWKFFLQMNIGGNEGQPDVKKSTIYVFYAILPATVLNDVQSMEAEQVGLYKINRIWTQKTVANLQWLIPMVLDRATNPATFLTASIDYP
jgi:8-oxo-dGTP diphosphatase